MTIRRVQRNSVFTSSLIILGLHQVIAVQTPFTTLQQPGSTSPSDHPYRELPWGDVNILATTDTHGWLLGHQRQEPNYSGDWGDLYSFVHRLKEQAARKGVDFLLVDSGDRVDGNGLVDAEPLDHVKGWTAMKYFQQMPYDVITTGNHELYRYPVTLSTYENLVQHYGDRFVASNVNITIGNGASKRTVTYGNRFRKFRTAMGRNVTALGPLFDFRAHPAETQVQAPHDMIREKWFFDAIAEEPSFFLLVGHMSIRKELDSEWSRIVKAIRAVHPTTPILIFGGHHHIRDCTREDDRSMSIAAGRYMETVGWMSVKGLGAGEELVFERRYLDQNRNTYEYHVGKHFDTSMGKSLTRNLTEVSKSFNLTMRFGTAPQSYYLARHPHTSDKSILNLLTTRVLPLLVDRPDRPYPSWTVLNSGSVRFDIFKGPFTRNDQWIILPFTNSFLSVQRVKRSVAAKMLKYLNLVGEHTLAGKSASTKEQDDRWYLERESLHLEHLHRRSVLRSSTKSQDPAIRSLSVGYVTQDNCGGLGDDTLHRPVPSVWQPIFVSTELPSEHETEFVDIVFFDFIQPDILGALNTLQDERVYGRQDVVLYVEGLTANTLMQEYALREWN